MKHGLTTALLPVVFLAAACTGGDGVTESPDSGQMFIRQGSVTSLTVEPSLDTALVGDSARFVARLRDDAGNVLSSGTVKWAVADSLVARIERTGDDWVILRARRRGGTTVTATSHGRTAAAELIVNLVASVTVTPPADTIAAGDSTSFRAELRDYEGNPVFLPADCGPYVTWTVSDSTVARIVGACGTGVSVRGLRQGVSTIVGTSEGQSGSAQIVVTDPLPITRLPTDGWGDKEGTTLVKAGMLYLVKTSDARSYEVHAGYFVSLAFANIPPDSTVKRVLLRATYAEEAGFAPGAALWQIGGGTPTTPFVAMEMRPQGFGNTLTWDLTPWVRTANRVNDLMLTVLNLDRSGKTIRLDQVSLDVTYGPTAPKAATGFPVTLFVLDGWNSAESATLVATGKLRAVNYSDDVRAELAPGAFASYRFTRVPGGSVIQSVKVRVEHHEEDGFAAGALVWRVGGGLLASPTTLAKRLPAVLSGDLNEGTEVWGAYYAINTAALVNDLKFVVRNNDVSGKRTKIDRVSVVVTHKEP